MIYEKIKLPTSNGEEKEFSVIYDPTSLNIHIENSYLVKGKKNIKEAVNRITSTTSYVLDMLFAGYLRSKKSLCREWAAHNFLYDHDYQRVSTKDVDLNQDESWLRRLGYFLLSMLYKK